jgi:hypothetical protein
MQDREPQKKSSLKAGKMNKILFSFGTARYRKCLEALEKSAKKNGHVNAIFLFNETNIDAGFYSENSHHFSTPRGFGYWIWKAYFINKFLANAETDDVFFYIDSSNEVLSDLTPLYEMCHNTDKGIILFDNRDGEPSGNVWKNNMWTKSDCFNIMNMEEDKYIFGNQVNASYILFRKTDFSVSFFAEFLDLCRNFNLISDAPNITENFNSAFRDHRHDQSILSLLSIKHDIVILRDPSQVGTLNQSFLHARGKYLI